MEANRKEERLIGEELPKTTVRVSELIILDDELIGRGI